MLNPNAYHDLLLQNYYSHYNPHHDRHGASVQTIKVSSSSINPIQQTTSPILADTTAVNDLPEIIINKKADELRSGFNKDTKRKSGNEGKRSQKLVETTTFDDESFEATTTDTPSTFEPVTVIRRKKEADDTTLPTDETFETTTFDSSTTEVESTTLFQNVPVNSPSDSLTEGSAFLQQVLMPPSHTIATFKPTVPMKGSGYGAPSLNNIDLIYLTTMTPPSQTFKRTFKFHPSPRDYYLDKSDKFVPLYFRDVNSNHFELPVSDKGNIALYEFEPLLN